MDDRDTETLVILYPSLRYDLDSVMEVVGLWKCPEVQIYAIEDFDRDYGRNDYEPYGMPHSLEKIQSNLTQQLIKMGAVIDETVILDESSESDSESGYDASCWIIKFSITEQAERGRKIKKREELRVTKFTLTYFYDIDAFGEEWPSMEPINVLIHTNGPLDPEIVGDLLETPYEIDVCATREMIENVWKGSIKDMEPIDTGIDLYMFNLGEFLADDSSSDD